MSSFDLGGLLNQALTGGMQIYQLRLQQQAAKRAGRGGKLLTPMPTGWGGMMGQGALQLGNPVTGPMIDYGLGALAGAAGAGIAYETMGGDDAQVGGAVRYDRCGRQIPAGYRVDQCGNIVPVRKGPPSQIEVDVTDERTGKTSKLTYLNRGRAVLFAQDLSAVKRVQRVAATCSTALAGKPHRRRSSSKRRKGRKRRACRTLTAKQLAAGFGGAAYRK